MVSSNPEAEIRWYHKFSSNTNDETDLSYQYLQENSQTNIWYIQTEQLNETNWKTSLFIKVNIYLIEFFRFYSHFSAYTQTNL